MQTVTTVVFNLYEMFNRTNINIVFYRRSHPILEIGQNCDNQAVEVGTSINLLYVKRRKIHKLIGAWILKIACKVREESKSKGAELFIKDKFPYCEAALCSHVTKLRTSKTFLRKAAEAVQEVFTKLQSHKRQRINEKKQTHLKFIHKIGSLGQNPQIGFTFKGLWKNDGDKEIGISIAHAELLSILNSCPFIQRQKQYNQKKNWILT